MKLGLRTPNVKKSIKARTTGRLKRAAKSGLNPLYGKKGMGILNPKRALYNKIYKKTSVDPLAGIKERNYNSLPFEKQDQLEKMYYGKSLIFKFMLICIGIFIAGIIIKSEILLIIGFVLAPTSMITYFFNKKNITEFENSLFKD